MVFAAIVVIFGLVTKQPRRYWLFAAAAVATQLLVGTAWFHRTTHDGAFQDILVLALGWGIPIWLAVRGHEQRNVTLATRAFRRTLAKWLLGAHVCALIVESDNGRLAVDLDDYGVGWKLRKRGKYEPDQINTIKKYLTAESRVLVVGAHVGSFVVPISKACKKVVAVEADPDTYRLLTANLALNDVSNCHAVNIAASDKRERIDFLVDRANTGGNKRVPKTRHPMYYSASSAVLSVDAFALDEYLDDLVFDLVQMDIEGSEYLALRGMKKILAQARVLVVEFLPHHLKHVSGVTVEEFLSVIPSRFRALTIPSKGRRVDAANFVAALNEMFAQDQGDDIIFETG